MEWYEKLGFSNKGKSEAQFGGGGWFDMVCTTQTDTPPKIGMRAQLTSPSTTLDLPAEGSGS